MKRVIFRPAAAADVEAAYRWYEGQRRGLGDDFLAAAREAIERQLRPSPSPTLSSTVRHDEFFFIASRTVCSIASLPRTSLLWRASTRAVLQDAGNLAMARLGWISTRPG